MKINSTNISIGLIALLILGLFTWSYVNKQAAAAPGGTAAKSALTAPETFYDFGDISMKDGLIEHSFVVSNDTAAQITVKTVLTSCMCTTAYLSSNGNEKGPFGMVGMGYVPPANETIEPGGKRTVRVVFDPNAHGPAGVGLMERIVTLTDTTGGETVLQIRAMVRP